jgi:Asp-tRNA(Asn)/Glu-tRNA(Gln) amidotransferase A subunit family amidase
MEWHRVTAVTLAQAIRAGEITVEEAVRRSLGRIQQVESDVQAWAFIDPGYALEQARRADRLLRGGPPAGPQAGRQQRWRHTWLRSPSAPRPTDR